MLNFSSKYQKTKELLNFLFNPKGAQNLVHLIVGPGFLPSFLRYQLHSLAIPQSSGTYRFKNQSATFFKLEAARGQMQPQDDFWTYTHVIYHFVFFF